MSDPSGVPTVEEVLRGAGITDNPAEFDSDIHSWRCSHPDIYGPCSCFADLVNELSARAALVLAEGRAEALESAAEVLIAQQPEDYSTVGHAKLDAARWLRDRAATLRRANPESEDR